MSNINTAVVSDLDIGVVIEAQKNVLQGKPINNKVNDRTFTSQRQAVYKEVKLLS